MIQGLVDYWNSAQTNSGVSHNVELARTVEVAYTESNDTITDPTYGTMSKDLYRFWKSSDGYMDNIHDLRDLYDADLCMLLVDNLLGSGGTSIGGKALEIGATSGEAFTAMYYQNITSTFAHEFGHLYGCRHDTYVDATTTPYANGHGLVYMGTGTNFRTIMAYSNACTAASTTCNVIANWSNPSIAFGGNPTGTLASANNASVCNNRASTMAGFQSTHSVKTFYNSDDIKDHEKADMYAHSSITTDPAETIVYHSGSSGTLRAGTSVTLNPGFWAKSGTHLEAKLESCSILFSGGSGSSREEEPDFEPIALAEAKSIGLQAFPNPFQGQMQFQVLISEPGHVKLSIYDLLGPERSIITDRHFESGTHKVSYDASKLAPGVYSAVLHSGNERVVQRIVRVQ